MNSSKGAGVAPIPRSSCIRRLFPTSPVREGRGRLPAPPDEEQCRPIPTVIARRPRQGSLGASIWPAPRAETEASAPAAALLSPWKECGHHHRPCAWTLTDRSAPPPSRARNPPDARHTPLPRPGPASPSPPQNAKNPSPRPRPPGPPPASTSRRRTRAGPAGPRRPAPAKRPANSADDDRRALRRPAAVFVLSAPY